MTTTETQICRVVTPLTRNFRFSRLVAHVLAMATVLVTVGTTRFDDLIQTIFSPEVQKALKSRGYQKLRIQSGHSQVSWPDPKNCKMSSISRKTVPNKIMVADSFSRLIKLFPIVRPLLWLTTLEARRQLALDAVMRNDSLIALFFSSLHRLGDVFAFRLYIFLDS